MAAVSPRAGIWADKETFGAFFLLKNVFIWNLGGGGTPFCPLATPVFDDGQRAVKK